MVTEWTVVTVIIALVGLVGTVTVPLLKNTRTLTRISLELERISEKLAEERQELEAFKDKASDRHGKIFGELQEHAEKLTDHEYRITAIEKKEVNK